MTMEISWNTINDREFARNIRDGIYAARCTHVVTKGSVVTIDLELCGYRTEFSHSWDCKERDQVFREIMGISGELTEAIGRIFFVHITTKENKRFGDFVCWEWLELAANVYNGNEATLAKFLKRKKESS